MEDKIEKFKKLVVEGDFSAIREKYPSKLMDKAYAYIDWEKVVKEKYQDKKCKAKKEKKPKGVVVEEFSRKRIKVSASDGEDSSDGDDVKLNIKKSVDLENVLKKNIDHLKAIEGGKKRIKKEVKEEKPAVIPKKKEENPISTSININDPTNPDLIVPRKVVPLTNRYEVKEYKNYYLIPQAYNIFLSSYETVFPLFETIRQSSEAILKEEKPINIIENMNEIHKDLYKITCENKEIVEIYYIDYLSTDLTVAPHLIPEKLYNQSIQYINRLFPHFYGDLISKPCEISTNIRGYFPVSDKECEIYEGRIYHIEGNCIEQPFESVRVVWYDQHKITGKWIISFFQLDNILSPWDIEISEEADRYKSLISIEHLPHNPTNILTITQTLMNQKYGPEGSIIFKSLINSEDCPRYYEVIKQPLSFTEVLRKAEGNLYNGNIDEYWKDLDLIISNAKMFNQKERFEWRCADILECCVERFKWENKAVEIVANNQNTKKEEENSNKSSIDFDGIATQRDVSLNAISNNDDDKQDYEESDTDEEQTQKGNGVAMEEEEEEGESDKEEDDNFEEEDTSDESQ